MRYYSRKDSSNNLEDEIFIKSDSSLVKLKLNNIIYIEALENYVTINTNEEKYTIHFTMKSIENQLPSDIFKRIHRSYIVNINMIKTINETYLDIIVNGTFKNLPIGSSFRELLRKNINVLEK